MKKLLILFSILILLAFTFPFQAMALTQDSQKILNNYRNYEQSGSPPATSQPYSPNNSPPQINAVPAPKTNVIPPTTSHPSTSPSSSSNVQNNSPSSNSTPNSPYIWIGIVIMIVVFVLVKVIPKGRLHLKLLENTLEHLYQEEVFPKMYNIKL